MYVNNAFPWLWFCFVHTHSRSFIIHLSSSGINLHHFLSDLISLCIEVDNWSRVSTLERNWWCEAVLDCVLVFWALVLCLMFCFSVGFLINMNRLPGAGIRALSEWPWTVLIQCSVRSDCTQWEWFTAMNETQYFVVVLPWLWLIFFYLLFYI